jgi:hypothetical protein
MSSCSGPCCANTNYKICYYLNNRFVGRYFMNAEGSKTGLFTVVYSNFSVYVVNCLLDLRLYLAVNPFCRRYRDQSQRDILHVLRSSCKLSYFNQILIKNGNCGHTVVKVSNMKFYKILSGGSCAVACRLTDVRMLIATFRTAVRTRLKIAFLIRSVCVRFSSRRIKLGIKIFKGTKQNKVSRGTIRIPAKILFVCMMLK